VENPPLREIDSLRRLARVWDDLLPIPLFGRRFGLDALLGLIPGVGDVASALVASIGLVVAARLKAPGSVLARMVYNIVIDMMVGAIPLVGDIFDFGWRAQQRNVALLERWAASPQVTTRRSSLLLIGVATAISAAAVATVWIAVWSVGLLFR
jgi:hypothetical protein